MSQDGASPRGGRKPPFYLAANVCAAGCERNNLKASGLPLTQRLRRLGIADL
jgi:hypothetical protein